MNACRAIQTQLNICLKANAPPFAPRTPCHGTPPPKQCSCVAVARSASCDPLHARPAWPAPPAVAMARCMSRDLLSLRAWLACSARIAWPVPLGSRRAAGATHVAQLDGWTHPRMCHQWRSAALCSCAAARRILCSLSVLDVDCVCAHSWRVRDIEAIGMVLESTQALQFGSWA